MPKKLSNLTFAVLFILTLRVYALRPEQILIIANSDSPQSVAIAEYYCRQRAVPKENILEIPLGKNLLEQVSRNFYNKKIAEPICFELTKKRKPYQIRCLLTIYGVPIKIANSPPAANAAELSQKIRLMLSGKLDEFREKIKELNSLALPIQGEITDQGSQTFRTAIKQLDSNYEAALNRIALIGNVKEKQKLYGRWMKLFAELSGTPAAAQQASKNKNLEFKITPLETETLERKINLVEMASQKNWNYSQKISYDYYNALESVGGLGGLIAHLQTELYNIRGKETYASVDSELSCVLAGKYPLYRWRKNYLQNMPAGSPVKTMMVCRLDGPGPKIVKGLIDKSIRAEKNGLTGKAYIDLRDAKGDKPFSYGYYDNSLKEMAEMLRQRTDMPVIVEKTSRLFQPGQCPQTALYCGWYSVKKYIDAFDFLDGAVGFHISSFGAMDLRNPRSSNWCPAMLADGITATLGAVNEPYLLSFPEPKKFFEQLLNGDCLVEAFYATKPFNSWQMVLIGDPLYKLNLVNPR